MKLSIITINYNNAEGLKKTLTSVASQTYHDIEHIIIDGGSTDGSVDIIREYEKAYPQPLPERRGEEPTHDTFASVWGAHTADSTQYDLLKANAEKNRKNPTEAESILWDMLKGNNIGLHFRRQHIILDYIVDFICIEKGLVIELDGGYHNDPEQKEYDERRTAHLQQLGYTELRFANEELLTNPDAVIARIKEVAISLPSLQGRGGERLIIWTSEPDMGIYNAMNKGIEIALGKRIVNSFNRSELINDDHTSNITHQTSSNSLNDNRSTLNELQSDYVQILNSGDILASPDVTERMMNALHSFIRSTLNDKIDVPILYGNMIKKDYITGKILGKSREVEYSLRQYFSSTMNHDCCYFRRDLFETYGLYDENLKIVSDWKWFLQAIGLGYVKPVYVDIDVTIFDASGISETNLALRNQERRQVLEELLPPAILADYDMFSFPITQYQRLKKYHLWGLVYFMERVLFKFEKWGVLR